MKSAQAAAAKQARDQDPGHQELAAMCDHAMVDDGLGDGLFWGTSNSLDDEQGSDDGR